MKKIRGKRLLAVLLIMGMLFQSVTGLAADTEATGTEVTDTETADTEEAQTETGEELKENSWRYENGEWITQESSDDGIESYASGNYTVWGIDVSHHNGTIDWAAVKNTGVDFVIIRCGYGSDITSQDDKKWEYNVSECERLGIPYGVYLYSYATTTAQAASEAEHVLRLLEGHSPSYPVYYDREDSTTINCDQAAIATTFCNAIEAAGYTAGVYANLNWWNTYLTDSVFSEWSRWVAQYSSSCSYSGSYDIWQYSSRGTVNGISGYVDINYFVRDNLFADVSINDWHYEAVYYVAEAGVMTGMSSGYFEPATTLSRAQFVTALYRLSGQPATSYDANRFLDVKDQSAFYINAVMWLSSAGVNVVEGYEDGNFGPSDPVTREQLALLMYRYASYLGANTSTRANISSYPDAGSVSSFAYEAMQWAVGVGLIKGDSGCLSPQKESDRATCATILMRFMEWL